MIVKNEKEPLIILKEVEEKDQFSSLQLFNSASHQNRKPSSISIHKIINNKPLFLIKRHSKSKQDEK